jgi:aminoglycoside phosphotransferase
VRTIRGYQLEARATRGESGDGAWFATDGAGRPVVLKWTADLAALPRFEATAAASEALRSRGYPAPRVLEIEVIDDLLVVAYERLDGATDVAMNETTVAHVLELVELQAGIDGPRPEPFGDLLVHSLTVGEDGWCLHESLRTWSPRTGALLARIEALGAIAHPSWFTESGLVHLDLHPGNLLLHEDGRVAGVVDWDGALVGDHRFDLTSFAFATSVQHGTPALAEPVWQRIEATTAPPVLRAYAAHQALRLVDWMIRHHGPADVDRWLVASEGLLDRYEV